MLSYFRGEIFWSAMHILCVFNIGKRLLGEQEDMKESISISNMEAYFETINRRKENEYMCTILR